MKVKIYSTPECHFCRDAKKFFKENKIKFEDINVAEDIKAAHEMVSKSGQLGVPVIEIGKNIIVGFDKERIEKILKIKNTKKSDIIYDSIIIGGGPAGITAGIYLARRKLKILMIYLELGGQATITANIENYAGFKFVTGQEFTQRLNEHIMNYDIICVNEKVSGIKRKGNIFEAITDKSKYKGKTIIVASGGSQRKLGIKGETEFLNKGVAYCATCDAPLFKNKNVAIIGGGNSALEAAIALENYAKKIYIVTINKDLKGETILIEKVKSFKNLEIIVSSETKEIKGNRFVEKIIINKKGQIIEIPIQGIFVEIGYFPNSDFINVKKNKNKEIIIDEMNQTSEKGIFAAGDVTNVFVKQIIVAAGEGAKAAISVAEYLAKLKQPL